MNTAWPAVSVVAALVLLLVLIIRYKVQAFLALLVVSLGLGLAAGMPPEKVLDSIGRGVGDILAGVAIILALGAMLGRMLDVSGAAEVIARRLVSAFGVERAPLAILVAGYLVGIPVLFNVGFLILIPIMWRLQRDTGQTLLRFVLPLAFSMGIAHSFIPPHPGIVGAVQALGGEASGRVMIETMLFGTLLGAPIVLFGWFVPGSWWARRQHVTAPAHLDKSAEQPTDRPPVTPPAFTLAVFIVALPLLLSMLGFGATILGDMGRLPDWLIEPPLESSELPAALAWLSHAPLTWLRFIGNPTMALFIATGLAFALLGWRRGMSGEQLTRLGTEALRDIGETAFLFGAAGGFKQVIQDTGAGAYIASWAVQLPLSPVLIAYVVAVLMRIALGSATAAILTASALLAGLARQLPGHETLLVLSVANGVTFMTQPADSGFWLLKEYCNLSVRDVMFRFNACRILMSLFGLALLLLYEAWR